MADGPDGEVKKVVMPPPYNVAVDLPTYDEAERSKQQEAEEREEDSVTPLDSPRQIDQHIGTDGMFLLGFIMSFIFNWLGLLAAFCLTPTFAGRSGAIAGFGLSVVKWSAIVRHNNVMDGLPNADSWIWWMLIIMGFLLFFRGCLQYIMVKYQANRLGATVRNQVYLYF